MPLISHKSLSDEQFEQRLVESARCDSTPGDIDRAWANFAKVMRQVVIGTEAGSGLHQAVGQRSRRLPHGTRISPTSVGPALQWLLVGALAGSVITATAVLAIRTRPARQPAPQQSDNTALAQPRPPASSGLNSPGDPAKNDDVAAISAPVASVAPLAPATHAGVIALSHPLAPDAEREAHSPSTRALASSRSQSNSSSASSNLAEQVRRLDAARTAIAVDNNQEALREVDAYHRDFPTGALSLDADVVAIEALAAQHDGAEVARRAATFLAEHPDDPHAARVKLLAAESARDQPFPRPVSP